MYSIVDTAIDNSVQAVVVWFLYIVSAQCLRATFITGNQNANTGRCTITGYHSFQSVDLRVQA
jgi:hypothetical protein